MPNDVPLNRFHTVPVTLGAEDKQLIYTCPQGVSAVVLFAQVSNVGEEEEWFSAYHSREDVNTELLHQAPIYPHDAARAIVGGRMILQTGDSMKITASSANLKMVLSLLETATGGEV